MNIKNIFKNKSKMSTENTEKEILENESATQEQSIDNQDNTTVEGVEAA